MGVPLLLFPCAEGMLYSGTGQAVSGTAQRQPTLQAADRQKLQDLHLYALMCALPIGYLSCSQVPGAPAAGDGGRRHGAPARPAGLRAAGTAIIVATTPVPPHPIPLTHDICACHRSCNCPRPFFGQSSIASPARQCFALLATPALELTVSVPSLMVVHSTSLSAGWRRA